MAQEIIRLTVKDFEAKLNTTANFIFLDVRTPEEFNSGHIAKAKMLDYRNSNFAEQAAKLDKSKPVFVYCASGIRSNAAAKVLSELGFIKVYDLQGGLRAWLAENKPVVK